MAKPCLTVWVFSEVGGWMATYWQACQGKTTFRDYVSPSLLLVGRGKCFQGRDFIVAFVGSIGGNSGAAHLVQQGAQADVKRLS